MKGGYKSFVNFSVLLKTKIINSNDNFYFKMKNTDGNKIKIPLKINSEGLIEYRKKLFSDNNGVFELSIIDNKIKLPDYLKNSDKEMPIIQKSVKLFFLLKKDYNIVYKYSQRKSIHKFIYRNKKSLYILGKKNKQKINDYHIKNKDNLSSVKIWTHDGNQMRGLGKNKNGVSSHLRYIISKDSIFFKAYEKWSLKNILLFVEDFNSDKINRFKIKELKIL